MERSFLFKRNEKNYECSLLVEPGNLSAEQLIANELVEAKKAKQERKQKKKDKKRRKKNKVAAPIDATDILGK